MRVPSKEGLISTLVVLFLASACGFRVDKTDPQFSTASGVTNTPGTILGYNSLKARTFATRCISCHGSSGGVSLETYASA